MGNTCTNYCGGMSSGTQEIVLVSFAAQQSWTSTLLSFTLDQNTVAISDASVQTYGSPVTGYTGGYMATYHLYNANAAVTLSVSPLLGNQVERW